MPHRGKAQRQTTVTRRRVEQAAGKVGLERERVGEELSLGIGMRVGHQAAPHVVRERVEEGFEPFGHVRKLPARADDKKDAGGTDASVAGSWVWRAGQIG